MKVLDITYVLNKQEGKNPKFEDLRIFENLEICSLESYFLLEAKTKVSV